MKQYLDVVAKIMDRGRYRMDRTGTGAISLFVEQMRFDLSTGHFPLVTAKRTAMRPIKHELQWFLSGSTNNNDLLNNNVHIWDEWAAEDGALGPIYGQQWRSWPAPGRSGKAGWQRRLDWAKENEEPALFERLNDAIETTTTGVDSVLDAYGIPHAGPEVIDQISELIENLKKRPYSRRHLVSAWNVADLPDESISPQDNVKAGHMSLAPCHVMFQFDVVDMLPHEIWQWAVVNKKLTVLQDIDWMKSLDSPSGKQYLADLGIYTKKLSCVLIQRSCDMALGVPYNIASYALLTLLVAQCVDMAPGEFIHVLNNAHIYSNHIEGVKEMLLREPFPSPTIKLNPEIKDIFSFRDEDIVLRDYVSHPKIDFAVAI